ncbi:Tubulin-like protein CetZ [Candidatus Methanoperedenaceae archaeon GB37]|nr:Tubulin-like protein CetZ [Candidatus Methanoperedenaceae archaeon GB37]
MLNILLLGIGQCGNRILDAINHLSLGGGRFSKYYSQQQYVSNVQTIAINTALNDLKELKHTRAKDRVHIPYLHGVGANRNIGKQCFIENRDMILRTIEERGNFDVAFVITSASGGTGSSFTPLLVKELKERYSFPIYSIIVLPFREEGTLYMQNAAFCLQELRETSVDGVILVDNQFLKQAGKDIKTAYDSINRMVADRFLFLIRALDSEMMMVTDLGDFNTLMASGARLATFGFAKGGKNQSIKDVIKESMSPRGLLFSTQPYEEAVRAMIIIQGDKKYLDINEITSEVETLSSNVGHVFKGVLIRNREEPQVLTIFSLSASEELDKFYLEAIEAIKKEKEQKERTKSQKEVANDLFKGIEPEY